MSKSERSTIWLILAILVVFQVWGEIDRRDLRTCVGLLTSAAQSHTESIRDLAACVRSLAGLPNADR